MERIRESAMGIVTDAEVDFQYEDDSGDDMSDSPIRNDHLFKILVIGEYGVGKTAIIKRYANNTFEEGYKLTIGVDFTLKTLNWDDDTRVTLQLWDIAGHERFSSLTRCYYKYAVGAIVVYDVTRNDTLVALSRSKKQPMVWVDEPDETDDRGKQRSWLEIVQWVKDLREKVTDDNGGPISLIVLANKCDLAQAALNSGELDAICREFDILTWFPTSAKDNMNIDLAIDFLIDEILFTTKGTRPPGSCTDTVRLSDSVYLASSDNTTSSEKSFTGGSKGSKGCCG